MTTMCDYKAWFDSLDFDLDDRFEEVHSLYRAIKDPDGGYGIPVRNDNGHFSVRYPADAEVELSIPEDKRDELAAYLDSMYELTVEGEYALRQALSHHD